MENNLKVFENPEFGKVRVVSVNDEPWFVAIDVCKALEVTDTGKATGRLDSDELTRIKIESGGQMREMIAVNEPGLYSLVLSSRKPNARAFKRWVTHDVIPSIRKHGAYMTEEVLRKFADDPNTVYLLADSLLKEHEKNQALEAKIEEDRPKVLFADAVAASDSTILVGELAKILCQNGVDIGRNRLFEWMRKKGYLIRKKGSEYNMPTQKSVSLGIMKFREKVITHQDGHITITKTPQVTGEGQRYFVNAFIGAMGSNI